MAKVTRNATKYNVAGNLKHQIYDITGTNGDTLDVGMFKVQRVNSGNDGQGITSVALTADTPAKGSTRLTFTSGGAFTKALVEVFGT